MVLATTLGVLSGVLQALGYVLYARGLYRHERDPNPTSWLMWAYGTTLVAVLEWDRNATWIELALPVVCSVSSVGIALLCWWKGTMRWPEHHADRAAFGADVLMTVGYLGAWFLLSYGMLSVEGRAVTSLGFLLLANATIITSFIPQMREYAEDPKNQSVLPWAVWTSAYAVLALATYLNSGFMSELMLYPTLCVAVHAYTTRLLVRPRRKARLEAGHLR